MTRSLSLLLATVALTAGGCGDGDTATETPEPTTTQEAPANDDSVARSPACRAVPTRQVEQAILAAGARAQPLERSANDSLDLSSCEYREARGPELYVEITIDTAPNTARRYYNLIAEGRQRATFDAIPDSTKPHGVRGVGNDRTHGGVGAYWVSYLRQLTAIDDRKLVKVGFHVEGVGDEASREASAELARAVYAET